MLDEARGLDSYAFKSKLTTIKYGLPMSLIISTILRKKLEISFMSIHVHVTEHRNCCVIKINCISNTGISVGSLKRAKQHETTFHKITCLELFVLNNSAT